MRPINKKKMEKNEKIIKSISKYRIEIYGPKLVVIPPSHCCLNSKSLQPDLQTTTQLPHPQTSTGIQTEDGDRSDGGNER
jgi:hypothetical protein